MVFVSVTFELSDLFIGENPVLGLIKSVYFPLKRLIHFGASLIVSEFFLSRYLSSCVSQLYQQGRLCQLGGEFCELEVFAKVLRASDKR